MNARDWLPSPQQMSDAVQLRLEAYTNTTVRQSLGMIFVLGLLAGVIPFITNWAQAVRVGTVLPLAQAVMVAERMAQITPRVMPGTPLLMPNMASITDLFQVLAGLDQPLSNWQAAGLSALGAWLNWPLSWLTCWLVYGLAVMVVGKFLGAQNTLQRFYAATGYAAVPLLLTGLSPVFCLGPLAALVGNVWALLVYIRAVQAATELTRNRAVLAVVLPALLTVVGGLIILGLLFFSVVLLTL